jgi:hypothetical protein
MNDEVILSHIKLKPKRDWDWYRPIDKWDLIAETKLCSKCNVTYTYKPYSMPLEKECCTERLKRERQKAAEEYEKNGSPYNWQQDYLWELQIKEAECKELNKEKYKSNY